MFSENQFVEPKKGWAIGALIISFLSIGLLILGRLINMSDAAKSYSYEGEAVGHMSTIIMLVFAIVSFAGLIISLIALIKSIRKPDVFGGKGIAVVALILNGIFSLISISVVLILGLALLNYFSAK